MNKMKTIILLLTLSVLPGVLFAQDADKHSLTVLVDGEEMQTQPRKVKLGKAVYYTGNISKPETMLRIMLGDFKGKQATESGTYLVVDGNNPPKKKEVKRENYAEKYKGIAVVRYVLETKSPRMAFHVGDSGNNQETITVNNTGDGYLEISFDLELNGTHWTERTAATVFGGLGRVQNKMESKLLSGATGFDWNIDPEQNGYKKTKEKDVIKLTNGKMIIKL